MPDVNAKLMVAGEIRMISANRDYTNRQTGEVREGKGRKAKVLTPGGFLDVSVGQPHDDVQLDEGSVVLWWVTVLPWTFPADVNPDGRVVRQAKSGTSYMYEGPVTADDVRMFAAPAAHKAA